MAVGGSVAGVGGVVASELGQIDGTDGVVGAVAREVCSSIYRYSYPLVINDT